jgi:hypothetical protein
MTQPRVDGAKEILPPPRTAASAPVSTRENGTPAHTLPHTGHAVIGATGDTFQNLRVRRRIVLKNAVIA